MRAFEEAGFEILESVVSASECDELLGALETSDRSRAGARHLLSNPAVSAVATDRRLCEVAREVLGSDAFPFRATLFDKSDTSNWAVVWHQDTALPLRERFDAPGWGPWSIKAGVHYAHAPTEALQQVVALRVQLDESSVRSGPLRVLPGTHRLGVLSDDEVSEIVHRSESIDCVVPRGGVLIMRPLLIHSSTKAAAGRRRVLHIEYAASRTVAAREIAVA